MKRTGWNIALRIAGLLLAVVALSAGPRPVPAAAAGVYSYDFERDLQPWDAGDGSLLTLDHSDNFYPLELGTGMALLAVPMRRLAPDQFTTNSAYMGARFPADPGDSVTVDWAAKPAGSCDAACTAVIYIGSSSSAAGIKWTAVKGSPSFDGWTTYHYVTTVAANPTDQLPSVYVALGVLRAGGPIYLNTALGVDGVRITIQANSTN